MDTREVGRGVADTVQVAVVSGELGAARGGDVTKGAGGGGVYFFGRHLIGLRFHSGAVGADPVDIAAGSAEINRGAAVAQLLSGPVVHATVHRGAVGPESVSEICCTNTILTRLSIEVNLVPQKVGLALCFTVRIAGGGDIRGSSLTLFRGDLFYHFSALIRHLAAAFDVVEESAALFGGIEK